MAVAYGASRFGAGTSSNSRSRRRCASRPAMKAAAAAANVASAGESATAACAAAGAGAGPGAPPEPPPIPVTAAVPAAGSRTTPDRRGARDRVVRRSAGPSVALMTRAYVSLITSHAAPYRFMPEHHVSRRLPDWMPSRIRPRGEQRGLPGLCGFLAGPPGSGGPGGAGDAAAVDARGHGQADDQGVAADRAGPLLAVAVGHIGTARGLRVELLEQPLLVASGAVPAQLGPAQLGPAQFGPAQLRHPGDLLGAMRHGPAGD